MLTIAFRRKNFPPNKATPQSDSRIEPRFMLAYGAQKSLVEILLRCWRLRGLKGLPGIPSAFPILFPGPTLRFQEMKIGW